MAHSQNAESFSREFHALKMIGRDGRDHRIDQAAAHGHRGELRPVEAERLSGATQWADDQPADAAADEDLRGAAVRDFRFTQQGWAISDEHSGVQ